HAPHRRRFCLCRPLPPASPLAGPPASSHSPPDQSSASFAHDAIRRGQQRSAPNRTAGLLTGCTEGLLALRDCPCSVDCQPNAKPTNPPRPSPPDPRPRLPIPSFPRSLVPSFPVLPSTPLHPGPDFPISLSH